LNANPRRGATLFVSSRISVFGDTPSGTVVANAAGTDGGKRRMGPGDKTHATSRSK